MLSEIAFSGAILAGRAVSSRSHRVEILEQDQADAASRAAADERLRIAQELLEIVAHSLGVIAVQAGVGMTVIDTDAAEAPERGHLRHSRCRCGEAVRADHRCRHRLS